MMEHKYVNSTWNQTTQMDIKHKDFSDAMVIRLESSLAKPFWQAYWTRTSQPTQIEWIQLQSHRATQLIIFFLKRLTSTCQETPSLTALLKTAYSPCTHAHVLHHYHCKRAVGGGLWSENPYIKWPGRKSRPITLESGNPSDNELKYGLFERLFLQCYHWQDDVLAVRWPLLAYMQMQYMFYRKEKRHVP